ncbi:MAG: OmpA family protein [Proteobacteria bacterium]|nr:OmpA family protein [Pseudomonadota bacterium]
MNDETLPPIIVIKKKKGHGGHHGGAWKVAYADFVTAMMALFIVLWIVGQSKEVKQYIGAYFNDPGIFESGRTGGILPEKEKAMSLPPSPIPADKRAFEMETLKAEASKISKTIDQTPEFDRFKDKIMVSVSNEGMRINLVEASEGLFFDIGKSQIKPETVKLLHVLAASHLGKLKNGIIIEGYTDARPYVSSSGYSNWELSTERANSARKILEEGGLRKDQILEVRGFADRNLRLPDKPLDFSNRRVSILLPLSWSDKKGSAQTDQYAPINMSKPEIQKIGNIVRE